MNGKQKITNRTHHGNPYWYNMYKNTIHNPQNVVGHIYVFMCILCNEQPHPAGFRNKSQYVKIKNPLERRGIN